MDGKPMSVLSSPLSSPTLWNEDEEKQAYEIYEGYLLGMQDSANLHI